MLIKGKKIDCLVSSHNFSNSTEGILYLSKCDVASISKGGYHEARSIAEVLVVIAKLSIANVCKAIVNFQVPP